MAFGQEFRQVSETECTAAPSSWRRERRLSGGQLRLAVGLLWSAPAGRFESTREKRPRRQRTLQQSLSLHLPNSKNNNCPAAHRHAFDFAPAARARW